MQGGVSNRFKEKGKPGDTMIRIEGANRPEKRRRIPIVLIIILVLLVGLILLFVISSSTSSSSLGRTHKPNSQHYIYMVADRDEFSKNENNGNYESALFFGLLKRTVSNSGSVRYSYEHKESRTLTSPHIESKKGKIARGMEISALTFWNRRLYTCCDRTGIVYEIRQKEDSKEMLMLPRYILNVGNGDTDPKGFKCEWMTTKDGMMIVGSIGKEWTTPDGVVLNSDPLYVKYITTSGIVHSVDWTKFYGVVRSSIHPEVLSPGYAVQEAVAWNPQRKKWFFLPRRISKELYDDKTEIEKGAFKIISLGEEDKKAKVVDIDGKTTKFRGFSEVKFIHGHANEMVALRTEEEYHTGITKSYMMVVDVDGNVLMDETFLAEDKLEGLEISDVPFFG